MSHERRFFFRIHQLCFQLFFASVESLCPPKLQLSLSGEDAVIDCRCARAESAARRSLLACSRAWRALRSSAYFFGGRYVRSRVIRKRSWLVPSAGPAESETLREEGKGHWDKRLLRGRSEWRFVARHRLSHPRDLLLHTEGQGNTQTDTNVSRPSPYAEQATPYALRNAQAEQPEVRIAPPQLLIVGALHFT